MFGIKKGKEKKLILRTILINFGILMEFEMPNLSDK